MKVTVLGCGASGGVPLIGCKCAACASDNPNNQRLRSSILLENNDYSLLVDASPDLRQQLLRNETTNVDSLLITHMHADHCHGIDDVRALNYNANAPLDVYASAEVLEGLERRFPYVFEPNKEGYGWYKPQLVPKEVQNNERLTLEGMAVQLFPQTHGRVETLGLRVEKFAYSTDVNKMSEEGFTALEGVDTWLVDCLRYTPSPTHAHLDLTLEWIARVKPRRAILTHMSHEIEFEELAKQLPEGVEPAYDGMIIEC